MEEFKLGGLVNNIDELLEMNKNFSINIKKENKTKIEYLSDLICAFDIEVSSFKDYKGDKQCCMYIWMLGINGNVIIGRTWEEFIKTINKIVDFYNLNNYRRLVIYVHNLAYEFQFIQHYFNWNMVFAREKRKPMKALTDIGIEFRCSYMLSGCSLEQVGKDLTKYKVNKKIGDLDYELIRTYKTKLTNEELGYCINDVLVVMAYIREELEYYTSITKIPMTKTGKVREYCREKCFSKYNYSIYRSLIKNLVITSIDEYDMLKRAFQGGFTHANYHKVVKKPWENVTSYDFTSSYPTVMVCEKYPMSKGKIINIKSLEHLIELTQYYCLIFNVEFENLESKIEQDNYLSYSKCYNIKDEKVNNGRIISAKSLRTTITDIDMEIIEKVYKWTNIKFGKCYAYYKSYLPNKFVDCILDFYVDKTTLKDVKGMENEYQLKKGMLNSCYGMSVTDIINDEISYNDEWCSQEPNKEEELNNYNNNTKRFLFYPWGVFITAYARRNLWLGILECGDDYIYSDTDSIKILNKDKHIDFINRYNNWITRRLNKACINNKLDANKLCPKTIKGKEKPLGVWDNDGEYLRFKTLGAKRYLVEKYDEDGNKIIIPTISGISKKEGSKWFMKQKNPFDTFEDLMQVPEDYTGRNTCTYIDIPMKGIIIDYQGNESHYNELSGIYIEKSDYNLTLSPIYAMLIGANEEGII